MRACHFPQRYEGGEKNQENSSLCWLVHQILCCAHIDLISRVLLLVRRLIFLLEQQFQDIVHETEH